MKILLLCSGGISSGMFARKIAEAGKEKGDEKIQVEAVGFALLGEMINKFDVVLAAPQLRFNEKPIKETCERNHKKYIFIDSSVFGMQNGLKGYNLAKKLLEEGEQYE